MCIFSRKPKAIEKAIEEVVYFEEDQFNVPIGSVKISDIMREQGLTIPSGQGEASITYFSEDDQFNVPIRSVKISDIIREEGLTIPSGQSEASITTPPPPSKPRVFTPSVAYKARQVIKNNIEADGLPLDQGGVKVEDWKEETEAVKRCGDQREPDDFVAPRYVLHNSQIVQPLRHKHRSGDLKQF